MLKSMKTAKIPVNTALVANTGNQYRMKMYFFEMSSFYSEMDARQGIRPQEEARALRAVSHAKRARIRHCSTA